MATVLPHLLKEMFQHSIYWKGYVKLSCRNSNFLGMHINLEIEFFFIIVAGSN